MQKKLTKGATKLPIKKKCKGKKGEREEKNRNRFAKQKSKFWLMRMHEKPKKLLD